MTIGETLRIAIIGRMFLGVNLKLIDQLFVVSGGPAGLSLAIGLKRKGFQKLIVYEREENHQVRHQGWSISLFSPDGGLAFIEHLDLLPEFTAISFQPCFRALDGETGRTLLYKPDKGNGRRFKRGDLREALYQVCRRENINIIWNAQVKSFDEIDEKIHIHFVDQQTEIADLLIGADGIHSPLRKQLTGDVIRSAGYNAVVGLIKKQEDGSNDDLFEHEFIKNSGVLVSGRHVSCWYAHHVLHDEIYWSLSIESNEDYIRQRTNYDKKKLHDLALEFSQKFFPLISILVQRTSVNQMQDCLLFKDLDPIKQHVSRRYCVSKTGRITLIGDAAHAMIPFRGQGGNTALMDAWNLSDRLGTIVNETKITNEQMNEVLLCYENERIPVGSSEILESRENAARFHSASSLEIFFRNTIMRMFNLRIQFDDWYYRQS